MIAEKSQQKKYTGNFEYPEYRIVEVNWDDSRPWGEFKNITVILTIYK